MIGLVREEFVSTTDMEHTERFGAVAETPPKLIREGIAEVIIIGGFLGSGKTTLLKRLLDWELGHGASPRVIMSEFGDFDIDGVLINDSRIHVAKLVGGCACCDLRGELADSLKWTAQAAHGSHIYIETTGVADPAGILEAIAPVVESNLAVVRKVIVVYDANRHAALGKDRDLAEKQVKAADLIVLNKCDLVSTEDVEEIAAELAQVNPLAPIVRTVDCILDAAEVLKGESTGASLRDVTEIEATSGAYRSFAFLIDAPLSQPALERWLTTLPPSVIRVKGIVRLKGKRGLFEVHSSYSQSSITPFLSKGRPRSVIVVIAHPMRTDGLVRSLQACAAHD